MVEHNTALLTATDLVAGYQDGFRTSALSLQLRAGEILGLVGPNGAGKSTLMLTLLELQAAVSGTVTWKRNVSKSYLPQARRLPEHLPITVTEVLSAVDTNPHAALLAIGDPFGIRTLLTNSFQRLSGGQKQRVLLSRTFLGKPDVLILDEPCNHLDASSRIQFWNTLTGSLKTSRSTAAIVIDHDANALSGHAHQVIGLGEMT